MKEFKAGKYFIGDVSPIKKKYQQYIFFNYINGKYDQLFDNDGNVYNLLTSVLGIAPIDILGKDLQQIIDLGVVHQFENDFYSYYQDGVFYFGDIIINTNDLQIYQDLYLQDQQF